MKAGTRPRSSDLDLALSRILTAATYASVAVLAVGVLGMVVNGIGPLDPAPPFDPATLAAGLAALQPEAFLWLGLIMVIATPSLRVVAAMIGFARGGERAMAAVSLLVLVVIFVGIVLAVGLGG